MKKFRRLGFIEYNGELKIHNSLLNVILYDQFALAADPVMALPPQATGRDRQLKMLSDHYPYFLSLFHYQDTLVYFSVPAQSMVH